MLTTGLTGGLLLGLIAAVFVKHARRSLVFATLGLIGCGIGGAVSFLIPNRYISRAVIRVVPYDQNFEQALNRLKRPGLSARLMHLDGTPQGVAVELAFEDTHPEVARDVLQSTISTLVSGIIESQGSNRPRVLELLDNANLPLSPAAPNRYIISLIGLCIGFVAAMTAFLIQRRRPLKHA